MDFIFNITERIAFYLSKLDAEATSTLELSPANLSEFISNIIISSDLTKDDLELLYYKSKVQYSKEIGSFNSDIIGVQVVVNQNDILEAVNDATKLLYVEAYVYKAYLKSLEQINTEEMIREAPEDFMNPPEEPIIEEQFVEQPSDQYNKDIPDETTENEDVMVINIENTNFVTPDNVISFCRSMSSDDIKYIIKNIIDLI